MKYITPVSSFGNSEINKRIGVWQTTLGEVQSGCGYGSQNMGFHVNDFDTTVHANRMNLLESLIPHGVKRIHWLNQVHSTQVITLKSTADIQNTPHDADAFVTKEKGVALAIMTADCLPVVFSNSEGTEIGAAHAGWRGLAEGVLENTIYKMSSKPSHAWVGVAIQQQNFEVGQSVYDAFVHKRPQTVECFVEHKTTHGETKYLADLPKLAQLILEEQGLQVEVEQTCSYESSEFYSHRLGTHLLDTNIGRMATLIWIKED